MTDPVFGETVGTVLPGFVDIQLNGGFGHDFTSDPSSIWEVARALPTVGVTAFVPTVISAPPGTATQAMDTLRAGPPDGWIGATPIGIHVEGPMIAPTRRGAHPIELLADPTPDLVDRLIESGPPLMVTMAPELAGAEEAIRALTDAGTIVSLGHSDAGAGLAEEAIGWGAGHATHLFNAMSGLHHRTPGLAATVLLDDRITTGLIADGAHVSPAMLRLALRVKGPDRIALVTDSISAMGLPGGRHRIGSVDVVVDGITVRDTHGTLAGSAATMAHLLRTMMGATGCSLADASAMTAATPSRIVGHRPRPDDQVLVDENLDVVATSIGGEVVYRRDAA